MAIYADSTLMLGSSKEIVVALFVFFLGAFGAHKFYLGYTKQAVIMLLSFLLGFIPVTKQKALLSGLLGLQDKVQYDGFSSD